MLKSFTPYKPLSNLCHLNDIKNKKIIKVVITDDVLRENPNNDVSEENWLMKETNYKARYNKENQLELELKNGNRRIIKFKDINDFNKKFKIRTKGIFSRSKYSIVDPSISKKRSPSPSSRRGGKKQKKYTRRRRR